MPVRRSVATLIPAVIFLAGTALLHPAAAQQSDADAVNAALTEFLAAATARDVGRMERLWAQEPTVTLVLPPDKTPAIGWDAAKKSWQARFDAVAEWKVFPRETSHIQIREGTAITSTVVGIQATTKAGAPQSYSVLLTQVFVKHGDRWLLVANHGSRAPD